MFVSTLEQIKMLDSFPNTLLLGNVFVAPKFLVTEVERLVRDSKVCLGNMVFAIE